MSDIAPTPSDVQDAYDRGWREATAATQKQVRYLVAWTGGYEQPSYAIESDQQKAMERAAGWRADMDERDQVDIVAFDGNGNVRLVDTYTIDSEDDNG